ncbi:methyltransferase domain-containing protein [Limnohabitans sp.]|uniref:methyltransferase domain-containing protein n=1 Tax=Limnohabitans sp. TaxID=1907725 RepID=UPI0033416D3F
MLTLSRRLAFVLLSFFMVGGFANTLTTDPNYKPARGQSGKDVIWIPTPPELVEKMLTMAKVTPQDRVFDLGSGDGIIPIAAAQKFKANAVGIEFNANMAEFARRKVAEAGMQDKVRIITGDIFKEDFSSADVVTMYLLPDLNLRLRPTILKMKPGTRVVAHAFDMGDWQPDESAIAAGANAYMWIVPASVQGGWGVTFDIGKTARINLEQTFQNVGGTITVDGRTLQLLGVRLRGEDLSFQFRGETEAVSTFKGKVSGNSLSGKLSTDYLVQTLDGRRL